MADRVRRTKEEIIADLDKKIQYHKDIIVSLEVKKENVQNPKQRAAKKGMKTVLDKAKEAGLSPEEIAKKLGISLED